MNTVCISDLPRIIEELKVEQEREFSAFRARLIVDLQYTLDKGMRDSCTNPVILSTLNNQ